MHVKTLGIIGLGAFGTFVKECAERETSWVRILTWDAKKQGNTSLEQVLACDAVLFAVPPKAYVSTLKTYVPRMRPDAIVIDVCTVKMVTLAALKEIADGRPYIATHPMFGRQSWLDQGKSLKGLQLVVCENTLDDRFGDIVARFLGQKVGLSLVAMSAEQHDRTQARQQLLPQYIGMVIKRAGFAIEAGSACTVSGRHFYRAMEIVKYDEELFLQCSQLNPFWPQTLAEYELADAQHRLAILKHRNGVE